MIIIVEGIDGVGKTTLCRKIEKEYGFKYFNDPYLPGPLEMRIINEKLCTTMELLRLFGKDQDIIIDRFHVSEYVYGLLNRRYLNNYVTRVDRDLAELSKQGYNVKLVLMITESPLHLSLCELEHKTNLDQHQDMFIDYMHSGTRLEERHIITRAINDHNIKSRIVGGGISW